MIRPDHIGFYIAGFIAAGSFARTAWVYPNITRWFYLGDLMLAIAGFVLAALWAKAFAPRTCPAAEQRQEAK